MYFGCVEGTARRAPTDAGYRARMIGGSGNTPAPTPQLMPECGDEKTNTQARKRFDLLVNWW